MSAVVRGAGRARSRGVSLLALALCLAGVPVSADDAAGSLEEITVTARKRAEPLAEVPLAIQVLGRDELRAAGIDSLSALASHVPGLYVEPMWGGTNAAPTLRGQSHPGAGGDTVGVFVDGVLQRDNAGDDAAMFDLERIEVVKGPQSTTYGEGTFAGAINFVTRRPGASPEREFSAVAGTAGYRGLSGAISGPIGAAGWRARLSAGFRDLDGTGVNLANRADRLGGSRKWGVSAVLEYLPQGAWRFSGTARVASDRRGQPAFNTLTASGYNCGSRNPQSGYWSFYCGDIPISRAFNVSPDIPDSLVRTWQLALRAEWQGEQASFENLAAYYRSDADSYRDFDGTATGALLGVCSLAVDCVPLNGVAQSVRRFVYVNQVMLDSELIEAYSEELRLRFGRYRAHWLLGAQASNVRQRGGQALGAGPVSLAAGEQLTEILPATPQLVGPLSALNDAIVPDANHIRVADPLTDRQTTVSMFAGLDYALATRVNLHGEYRAGLSAHGVNTLRGSIDYRPGGTQLWWLSFAKGGTAGGSNHDPTLIPSEQNFGPESLWTYEWGYRGTLWAGRLDLDAALFYEDWRDAQIDGPANTPGSIAFITRNLSGIHTRGVEWSARLHFNRRWSSLIGMTLDDPRFKQGSEDIGGTRFCGVTSASSTSNLCTIGPSRALTQGSGFLVPYVDGNVVQRAPREQWTASLQYEQPAAPGATGWSGRLSLEHQGSVYVRPIDGAYDGERTLLNARLGCARGSWSLGLWGSNLTDRHYISAVASRPRAYFRTMVQPQDLMYGEGRRWGLDLHWNH